MGTSVHFILPIYEQDQTFVNFRLGSTMNFSSFTKEAVIDVIDLESADNKPPKKETMV